MTDKLIYIILLTMALQSCTYTSPSIGDNLIGKSSRQSTKKESPRRAPNNNVNAPVIEGDSNVQKSDPNYDAYQHYQAPNPPIKRRPALNMRELNETMDRPPAKPTAKKKVEILVVAQDKKEAAAKAVAIAKAKDAERARELSAANTHKATPKKKPAKIAAKAVSETSAPKVVSSSPTPTVKQLPKQTVQQPISQPTTKPATPQVNLPETKNSAPSTTQQPTAATTNSNSQLSASAALPTQNTPNLDLRTATQSQIEQKFEAKNAAASINAGPAPAVSTTTPAVTQAPIAAPAAAETTPPPPPPALPQNVPMPTLPSAMSQATESSIVSRLNSLNELFIECYFAIKSMILSIFNF